MAIASCKWRSRVISCDRELQLTIASFKPKSRDKSLYCYLLTLIESKSNRKLLSGNEKYRDVPYGPPYISIVVYPQSVLASSLFLSGSRLLTPNIFTLEPRFCLLQEPNLTLTFRWRKMSTHAPRHKSRGRFPAKSLA